MAEPEWEGRPERPILRRAVRHRLRRFDPTIHVIAEDFHAETSTIDLLAVGGEGEMVSIRIGRGEDDAALLTRALGDLTWLRPRLADFLKLAPGLGLEPSAEPRIVLVCPNFASETRAAVENFPTRSIDLLTYHCLRHQGQLSVLLESWNPCGPQLGETAAMGGERRPSIATRDSRIHLKNRSAERLADPPSPSSFRTGLTDADLHSEVEEEKILD